MANFNEILEIFNDDAGLKLIIIKSSICDVSTVSIVKIFGNILLSLGFTSETPLVRTIVTSIGRK